MKATLGDKTVAESNDIVEVGGYHYFPNAAVRLEWLEMAPKTPRDLECPHGVQFYDLVQGKDRSERAAWSYEKPGTGMKQIDHWIGFWEDVEVG